MVRRRTSNRAAAARRPGIVLLEAMVALALIGLVGLSFVTALVDAERNVDQGARAERELVAAAALMDAAMLWSREELDMRLGSRTQGPWRLTIQRASPTLYALTLTDSLGRRTLLQSAVLRTESAP
ncbi:MAG: hypothetical protein K2R93_19715 [Gemmatimonadaceae bacterium]|nr:hypothetical protein [Gemmatimonadaceae bacterium]